jgi:hypothetical protein
LEDSVTDLYCPTAAYRRELCAEAELTGTDLAEIEGDLRELIENLRARGIPLGEAIAEAARRLGDPRRGAREDARVRTPFGAKLSRLRAWSAAALLLPFVGSAMLAALDVGVTTRAGVDASMVIVLFVAVCARLTWARPIVLGGMAFFVLPSLVALVAWPTPIGWMWLAAQLGVMAVLLPWRRRELGPVGWALVAQAWNFGAASLALGYSRTPDVSSSLIAPAAVLAVACSIAATLGIIMRGRWAAVVSLASAGLLALSLGELPHSDAYRPYVVFVGSGIVGALAASVFGWRHARSNLGSLRGVLG